jgi:hypothetical protein
MSMFEPRIIHTDDYRVIAEVDSVVVLVATRPATPDHVRIVDRSVKSIIREHPSVSYVHVVDSLPGEPRRLPDDTRKALIELAKKAPPQARCVGIALLADGFIAAAMRGVATAALVAFRSPVPLRVCSTIDETCMWVEQSYRKARVDAPPARELQAAIEQVRTTLPSRRS